MARMYSRKRGKARSKKPMKKVQPIWVRYESKEIELLVTKLAKEGKSSSQIGIVLRDTYGIPDSKMITKKGILEILRDKNLLTKVPEDILFLIKKLIAITKHIERNRMDMGAKRGMILTQSKIRRLVKYYKRTNKLPEDWKFDPTQASMYIQ